MSPKVRLRYRRSVMLHMVLAFVITILVAQLWLFTAVLDVMQSVQASPGVAIASLLCSFAASGAIWGLIRFFVRQEENSGPDV